MFIFAADAVSQETADVQVTVAVLGVIGTAIASFFAWLGSRRAKEARNGNSAEHSEVVTRLDGLRETVQAHRVRSGERFGELQEGLRDLNEKFGRHLEWHLDRKDPPS